MRLSTTSLARGSARRPWLTIGIWGLALVAAAVAIVLVLPGSLTAQYTFFGKPGAQVGKQLLADRMGTPQKANEVILVRSPSLTAGDPAFRAAVLRLQQQVAALGPGVVDGVASAYAGGDKTLVSADGHTTILPVVMAGDLTQAEKNVDKVHAVVSAADGRGGLTAMITGTASIQSDFGQQADKDLRQGEGIGVPIALIVLLIVFGAVVAAMLPIFLALIAITLAVALTALLGQTFDMSVFAVNMVSMMGLATGIDYSLFIVSRYREERRRGLSDLDAITVAGGTASRAVLFSGLTVVLALLGLLLVPTNVFVSLGAGAILVVSMSVLAALTLLPAVLRLLGRHVDSLRIPYLGRRVLSGDASGRGSWIARVAERAMRRPALALAVGAAVLLLAASPAISMKTGVSGVSTFPDGFESKRAFAVLDRQFPASAGQPRARRRGRAGELAGRAARHRRAAGRAGREHRVRPRPGPGEQGRRPDPDHRSGQGRRRRRHGRSRPCVTCADRSSRRRSTAPAPPCTSPARPPATSTTSTSSTGTRRGCSPSCSA